MQLLKMVKVGRVREPAVRFTSPQMIYDECKDMTKLDREHFVVFHLDCKNRILAKETVSIGSLNQTIVHPREVFKSAVHNGSAALICAHNHPTGDPAPSAEDRATTRRLREAGELIGIKILDHIIIGSDGKYFSFVNDEIRREAEEQDKRELEQRLRRFRQAQDAVAKRRATSGQVVLVTEWRLLEALVKDSSTKQLSEIMEIKQILEPIALREHGRIAIRKKAQTLIGMANQLIENRTKESQIEDLDVAPTLKAA